MTNMQRRIATWIFVLIMGLGVLLLVKELYYSRSELQQALMTDVIVSQDEKADVKSLAQLVEEYGNLPLVDAHNHNASSSKYKRMKKTWDQNSVDRIVLFGNVSEPSAVGTDKIAWKAYQENPDQFIPFFSGVNLLEESGLVTARENLEKGYFGIGEIAAASRYSEALANVKWKTKDPMDGILPQIYELCAQYGVPILLHIDPPNGYEVTKLTEAAAAYPDTNFIFAHANVFNNADNIEQLITDHPNLYIDLFPGFMQANSTFFYEIETYLPVIKKYPNQFMLSTDSGYGLESEEFAIKAMYHFLDAIDDPELALKLAHDNVDQLIRNQLATATQIEAIRKHDPALAATLDLSQLTKVEAGKLLIEMDVEI